MVVGATSNLQFNRQATKRNVAYVSETDEISATDITFATTTASPHRVGAATDITFQLLLQAGGNPQELFMNDLSKSVQQEVHDSFLNGTGTGNEPRGILATNGVRTVSHGANGGNITWNLQQEFCTQIQLANVVGPLKRLATPRVNAYGLTTPRGTGDTKPILTEIINPSNDPVRPTSTYAGEPVYISTLLPSTGTKGTGTNLNSLIVADWSECKYITFGTGDIITFDDITKARTGEVALTVQRFTDLVVLRPDAFARATDISVA